MAIKALCFDLDGTIYLGETLLPGAREILAALKKDGKKQLFVSNNPLRDREQYVSKLQKMGIDATLPEIINSSYVLCKHLKKIAPKATVYPIGEEALARELQENGFLISTDPEKIQYVIASFDRTFEYEKLIIALRALERGAHFIATNPDQTCPFEDGALPDAAAVIGAIEAMTGEKVEWVAGKPSEVMAAAMLEHLNLEPHEILMVGDRLQTDIALGKHGFKTALVLSGIAKREDLATSPQQPDFIIEGIWELPALLQKEGSA